MREPLADLDFSNWKGLATKTTPENTDEAHLRVAINTDHFTEYGGISKPPGMSRILNAIYQESGTTRPISWVGFYKAPDLNGQILRHVLTAAGTKLHKVTGSSLVALTGTGFPVTETRTQGLVHASAVFDDLMLIQNQDPDLVGRGDTPVKYDGLEVHRWGVVPPGSAETVQESFTSAAAFTLSGVTAADESTTTRDGAAVRVNKTSTAQVNGDITRNLSAFTIENTIPDRASVWVYIPRGQIANLSQGTTPAIQVFIGPNLTTNFYTFSKDRGALTEGWNQIFLNFYNKLNNEVSSADDTDDPEVTVTGSPGTSGQSAVRFRINSSSATQTVTGIIWDRFVTYDKGTLTATQSGAGATDETFAINSVYKYKVAFVSKYGHLSNAGPESRIMMNTAARDQIDLTGIPTSTDPQVIGRRLYRTVNDGEIFLFLAAIDNNSVTTYTDTTGDTGLSQTSPPFEGDVSDDNTPPPNAGIIKKWQRTVFLAGMPDRPDVVIWSDDDEPESFPTLNETRLDAKITAIYETYSGLVVETELGKWQVSGDNPDFFFNKVIANIGCVGRRAAGETRISGWAIDRDGMRLYDLNNPLKVSEVIRDKFDNDFNKQNIELLHSNHSKNRNCILMFVANSSGDYTGNNFIYQYPLDQVAAGFWWELQLPSSVNPLHVTEIEDTDGTFRLYMACEDGMLYELFDTESKNWVTANGSTEAITTRFQTTYIRLGYTPEVQNSGGYSGRAQPRFVELRWDGDLPATWTATVDTADGPDQASPTDTKTLTFTFTSTTGKSSLLRLPVPMMQPGEYVRLTLENSQLNVAGTVTGARMSYRVHPGNFPNLSA